MVKCIHGNVYPSECCRLRRDHFAAAALMGLAATLDQIPNADGIWMKAHVAAALADALLAELDKPQE